MSDFETFARDEIARLRAEADALEKTLKKFQASMSRVARVSSGEPRSGGGFGAVLDALAAAGPRGLSLDEMIEAAEVAGFEVKRNTLRSQLFTAKGKGQVEPLEAGRYRAPQPQRSDADTAAAQASLAARSSTAAMTAAESAALATEAAADTSRGAQKYPWDEEPPF